MKKEKKAQATMFIIIGVIIVVAIILIFFLFFRETETEISQELPEIKFEIENCIKQAVEESSLKIFEGNGYINKEPKRTFDFAYPQGYYKEGSFENVPYFCYTERVLNCETLEPNFIEHIRKEIENDAKEKVMKCFRDIENEVKIIGYNINIEHKSYSIRFFPNEIRIFVRADVEVSGEGIYERYDNFENSFNSPAYEIALIIRQIVEEESRRGFADINDIQKEYRYFNIGRYVITKEKIKVYTVRDVRIEKEIMFGVKGGIINVPFD